MEKLAEPCDYCGFVDGVRPFKKWIALALFVLGLPWFIWWSVVWSADWYPYTKLACTVVRNNEVVGPYDCQLCDQTVDCYDGFINTTAEGSGSAGSAPLRASLRSVFRDATAR